MPETWINYFGLLTEQLMYPQVFLPALNDTYHIGVSQLRFLLAADGYRIVYAVVRQKK